MGCALQRGYEFRSFALSESHLGCRRRCDRGPDRADGPGCHHTVSMTPRAVSRGCGTQRRPPAGGLFALPTRRPPVVMCLGLARDLSRAGPKTSSRGTTMRALGKPKSTLGDPLLRRAAGVLTTPRPSGVVRKYKKVEVSPPSYSTEIYGVGKPALRKVLYCYRVPCISGARFQTGPIRFSRVGLNFVGRNENSSFSRNPKRGHPARCAVCAAEGRARQALGGQAVGAAHPGTRHRRLPEGTARTALVMYWNQHERETMGGCFCLFVTGSRHFGYVGNGCIFSVHLCSGPS